MIDRHGGVRRGQVLRYGPRLGLAGLLAWASPSFAQVGLGPRAASPLPVRAAARDRAYPGEIGLAVDATDTDHKIMRVQESVPVPASGEMTLLYPQWETASHAPTGSVAAIAGLKITAGGRPVSWRRDPLDVFAFQLTPPPGAARLDIAFQYISPVRDGTLQMTPDIVTVAWQKLVLYPAGWYVRDIQVRATLLLPPGFTAASSLTTQADTGPLVRYAPISLETLIDSPVYAGSRARRIDLGALDGAAVRMDIVADAPADLAVQAPFAQALQAMVRETHRVFGSPHFSSYDFLVSLSDALPGDGGTEHLRSSENNFGPDYLLHPARHLLQQDLLAHEFVHSWNGKFRTPEGLWTADFNTPSRDDLLWVYEGQTQYWGIVLAARSGLRTAQQTLDLLALTAARAEARTGRAWKSIADGALDPVFDAGHGTSWPDWQGREDYYVDGVLLWLDADTLIRERTGGRRSLDDFAHAFFGVGFRSEATRTYTLPDICAVLAQLAPMDWAAFFAARLDAHDDAHLLDGLRRGGYRLVYTGTPSETFVQAQDDDGGIDLRSSLGLLVGDGGAVRRVAWESPAYRAGVGPAARLISVNGAPYSDALLMAAMRKAGTPFRLGFRQDGREKFATIADAGPVRYPHLERIGGPGSLDMVLAPMARVH